MAKPLAKEALKALAKAVAANSGLPMTDRERTDLAARLWPGWSHVEAAARADAAAMVTADGPSSSGVRSPRAWRPTPWAWRRHSP